MRFLGKVALITGGANGIGQSIATAFVREGAKVVVADIDVDAGLAYVDSLEHNSHKALFVECDVRQKHSVLELVQQSVDQFGTIDIAINNAGINHSSEFISMPENEWDRVLNTDLKGAFLVSQAVANLMISQEKSGVIVNISSVMAVIAMGDQVAYCAAKGGINQLTKAMALALVDKDVRVVGCAPGPVMTELMQKAVNREGKFEKLIERMPIGRIANCEEIARVVLFLASDDASYFVGQTIYPDGGRIIQAFPQNLEK